MGYVMNADETGDPELHIEIRRESLCLTDDYYPWRLPDEPAGTQHVFVYGGERKSFTVAPGRHEMMNDRRDRRSY